MTAPDRFPRLERTLPDEQENRFDELVRAHYPKLCRFIRRQVGSEAVAEDLAQDLLLRIWERRESFDFEDPLPYLYRAARNRALSHLRRERVFYRWRRATAAADNEERSSSPVADSGTEQLGRAIADSIDALPDRCRLIFLMSREQGLTYRQIGSVLGLSIKTVETQMGRALRALRITLAPHL